MMALATYKEDVARMSETIQRLEAEVGALRVQRDRQQDQQCWLIHNILCKRGEDMQRHGQALVALAKEASNSAETNATNNNTI